MTVEEAIGERAKLRERLEYEDLTVTEADQIECRITELSDGILHAIKTAGKKFRQILIED